MIGPRADPIQHSTQNTNRIGAEDVGKWPPKDYSREAVSSCPAQVGIIAPIVVLDAPPIFIEARSGRNLRKLEHSFGRELCDTLR
jgi:hypothetical protein